MSKELLDYIAEEDDSLGCLLDILSEIAIWHEHSQKQNFLFESSF